MAASEAATHDRVPAYHLLKRRFVQNGKFNPKRKNHGDLSRNNL